MKTASVLASILICVSSLAEDLEVFVVPAFYNFQEWHMLGQDPSEKIQLNPVNVGIGSYKTALPVLEEGSLSSTVLKGEVLYKSIVIQNTGPPLELSAL